MSHNTNGQITAFIHENFVFDDDVDLSESESLLDAGLIDSTGVLELVAFLEEAFQIEIEDADIIPENLDSIAAVHGFVQRKLMQHRPSMLLDLAS